MLKSLDALEKGFQEIVRETKSECGDGLERIRQLTFIIGHFHKSIMEYPDNTKDFVKKFGQSLVSMSYMELMRVSGHVLFLSANGLYRNAFDNIRYVLESIIQAVYIDCRHPEVPLRTKIEILKEVEDKREYHASRLIDGLSIDNKDKLKKEYKELSRIIHPSHKQVIATLADLSTDKGVPATVNCEEIKNIHDAMIRMYDIFFYLLVQHFPEVKSTLQKNSDVINAVRSFNLHLVSTVIKV